MRNPQYVKWMVHCMDLTSLNENDNLEIIKELCKLAETIHGHVAAVCVYPQFVSTAKSSLKQASIPVATVSNFPQGNQNLEDTLIEIQKALREGADEIDIVLPYEKFLTGSERFCFDYLRECRANIPTHLVLKVILETGELKDPALIRAASELAIEAGADFIKTSTGKTPIGATLEAAEIMLDAIQNQNRKVGLKISGGIRSYDQAADYCRLVESKMGVDWISSLHFRIGASSLLKDLLE